ncbi:50S ribosomal protein L10 [Candidatus Microgenomates bacterium]|jgi:large subunit ribosomal protein L10|nr:MAG: 50S ribosomal protein L10 [Candidatus Microgenomates bacterium]
MKKQDKFFEVDNLNAKIKDAKSVALVDYRGITVSQATALREKVKEAGGELQVVKNNLFFRALRQNDYEVEKEKLEGPSLALFANADEITPLKALVSFAKTSGLLPFKIGFMEGRVLSEAELNRFANLPSKQELQAKLVGMLASQPGRLVYALNYNLQRLALVLNAVKEKKQQ